MKVIWGLSLKRACYVSVVFFMCALNKPLVTDPILMKGAPFSCYIKAKDALASCCDCHTFFNKLTMNFSSYFVIWSV